MSREAEYRAAAERAVAMAMMLEPLSPDELRSIIPGLEHAVNTLHGMSFGAMTHPGSMVTLADAYLRVRVALEVKLEHARKVAASA